jgi:hypothetical protein
MSCSACKQFGGSCAKSLKGGASNAPLSYLNAKYVEPSGPEGSNRLVSESLLARPSLNHTGGKRKSRKCSRKHKHTRKCKKGGFYPTVMGSFVGNASRLVPAAAVQGYRMVRNYKHTRKNRK